MKTLVQLFVILLALSLPNLASASKQTGKVKNLIVRASDGLTYLYLDSATPSDKPDCAANPYWMIKDENSEVGKKQYSMLLAAHAAGRKISITGTGTCTRWGDGEDINAINLLPAEV